MANPILSRRAFALRLAAAAAAVAARPMPASAAGLDRLVRPLAAGEPAKVGSPACLPAGSPEEQAWAVLAQPPFEPLPDARIYFWDRVYPGTSPARPASGPGLDDSKIRRELARLLKSRPNNTPADVARGLELLDDPRVIRQVPDLSLRAALASLIGTIGELAIVPAWRDFEIEFADFGDPELGIPPGAEEYLPGYATVYHDEPYIYVNSIYRHEHFAVIGAILPHEALHTDLLYRNAAGDVAKPEETVATLFGVLVYLEQLLADPSLIRARTLLTRWWSTAALGLLNSRDSQGRLTLARRGGDNVLPGSALFRRNFLSLIEGDLDFATPGNGVLKKLLRRLGGGQEQPARNRFDRATLRYVDRHMNIFAGPELLRLCRTLRLDIPEPPPCE